MVAPEQKRADGETCSPSATEGPRFCAARHCSQCEQRENGGIPRSGSARDRALVAAVGANPQLRLMLRQICKHSPEFHLCGAFATGARAIQFLSNPNPRVVVLELALPDMCGLRCGRQLAARNPDLRMVVIMTLHGPEVMARAIGAGASVCLVPPVRPGQLLGALRFALQLPPRRPQASEPPAPIPASVSRSSHCSTENILNPRETEVIQLLARGLMYKEIEECLQFSAALLKKVQHQVFLKLNAQNMTEAVIKWHLRVLQGGGHSSIKTSCVPTKG